MDYRGRLTNSIWTEFLENDDDKYRDYKDLIELRLEELISSIMLEMTHSHPDYKNLEDVKQTAICMTMQQMLMIQRKNSPNAQKAMVIALFSDLPELFDFRYELIQLAMINANTKKDSFLNKIKKLFQRNR